MPKFSFSTAHTLTPEAFYSRISPALPSGEASELESLFGPPTAGKISRKAGEIEEALKNQFVVFQVMGTETGQTIAEASTVEPKIQGSEDQPDMYVSIELQSFHLGAGEQVDKNTRATMRLIIGKDKNSRDRFFDDVFWTISAGLDFYDHLKDQPARPEDFRADFNKALGHRPIEVPGGLANMTFEVIKHKDPKWWQRIFGFLKSDTGQTLISVVGFPAITQRAIQLLDEVFDRFNKENAAVLFQSRPMILALSKLAKQDYTAGNPRIRMGCLNPGFCVLARGRDFATIAQADAYYYPHYGILVPSSVDPGQVVMQEYDDPFRDVTYAVFKIGMAPTQLEKRLNFGSV